MRNKMLAVSWVLLLVLALLFGLSGCGSKLTAEEISSDTIKNTTTLQTVRSTLTMQEVIEVTGGSDPGKLTLVYNGACSVNSPDRELEFTTNITMDIPGAGKQNASADYYIMGGWMYVKMSVPGVGDKWIKQKPSEDTWSAKNQINQQSEILKTAQKVANLGTESVNGVDCYIIQVTPEINVLTVLGLQDQLSGFGLDLSKISDWGNIVKYYSVKEWIAKDKFLPVKSYTDMSLEILPQDLGNTTIDMDKITINMSGQAYYYDYNKPLVIQLPPEVQNAVEWPSQ
jgi:hypothetical protein